MEVYMKECSVCKETKELDQFDRRSRANGDKVPTGRCKACRNIYMRSYTKKKGKTGLTREEWLNSVRKPKLSPEERLEAGKLKWEAWYVEYKESGAIEKMRQEYRKKAEQEREAKLATGVKMCSKCKKEKPLSEYNMRNRRRRDNSIYQQPYHMCKSCRRDYNRYYEMTPNGKILKRNNRRLRDRRSRQATPKWLNKKQRKEIIDTYNKMRELNKLNLESYHVDHIIPLLGVGICGLHVPWNLRVIKASDNIAKSNDIVESIYTGSDVT